uniref:Uncharacterized protein n=1 Tax=Proteus vulgaris TaxID=585 RepID=Q8KJT4_PROVU|nr:hypothetical protein [Proteus vulgaris]
MTDPQHGHILLCPSSVNTLKSIFLKIPHRHRRTRVMEIAKHPPYPTAALVITE